jgi:hypothetical protein
MNLMQIGRNLTTPLFFSTKMNRLVMIEHITKFSENPKNWRFVGRLWQGDYGTAEWSGPSEWTPDGFRLHQGRYRDSDIQYQLDKLWVGKLPPKCEPPI